MQVMVCAVVNADECSPVILIESYLTVNAIYYWKNVLEAALKPWADKRFGSISWTTKLSTSHKAHEPRITENQRSELHFDHNGSRTQQTQVEWIILSRSL